MPTIIDLSKTIEYSRQDPWFMRVKIKHKSHASAYLLIRFFIGLPKKLFPDRFKGWADDTIKHMGVHATTHIDAPWHYGPICENKKAKTVDEIPLEWCYGNGVVLNFSYKKDNDIITQKDIEEALISINHTIQKGDIVLIRTDRDAYIGTLEYPQKGTGMSREATLYLIQQGVKVMGIDQWGWDLPLLYQTQVAKSTQDPNKFWEGHLVGLDHEYCHMEQLVNLSSLPSTGFKVCVFPLKIKGASAAPARVVAIIE